MKEAEAMRRTSQLHSHSQRVCFAHQIQTCALCVCVCVCVCLKASFRPENSNMSHRSKHRGCQHNSNTKHAKPWPRAMYESYFSSQFVFFLHLLSSSPTSFFFPPSHSPDMLYIPLHTEAFPVSTLCCLSDYLLSC